MRKITQPINFFLFFFYFFRKKEKKKKMRKITQPLQICIGPSIRIGRESWCLLYAGFFSFGLFLSFNKMSSAVFLFDKFFSFQFLVSKS